MNRNSRYGQQPRREPGLITNERITAPTVRLVGTDGHQIGLIPTRDALWKAKSAGLDLVLVAAGDVPVCRILDAGKYLFEKKRAEREQARRQRELVVETKEVQLRPVTDEHDLKTKARKAAEFLAEGHKVKVAVRFKGREQSHKDVGLRIVKDFLAAVGDHKIDKPISDAGREIVLIVAPVKTRAELVKERETAQD